MEADPLMNPSAWISEMRQTQVWVIVLAGLVFNANPQAVGQI